MQCSPAICVVLFSLAIARSTCFDAAGVSKASTATDVSNLQKVIELLNDMLQKGTEEKHKEEVQYNAYKQWCSDTEAEKKRSIERAGRQIDQLTADQGIYGSDVVSLGEDIALLDEDLTKWRADLANTTEMRKLQRADYEAIHKQYSDALDAIQQAINVLRRENYDRAQATDMAPAPESMLQLKKLANSLSHMVQGPPFAQEALLRLLSLKQQGSVPRNMSMMAYEPPEANAYEFQSHGVIEILEGLLERFTKERSAEESEELNSRHAYELEMQDLQAKVTQATDEKTAKQQSKANIERLDAEAQAELDATTKARAADVEYSAKVSATCTQKAEDFKERERLRTEELQALQNAVRILSDGRLAGAVENHLATTFAQGAGAHRKARAPALAHLRSQQRGNADGDEKLKQRVAEFLRVQAQHFSSREISTLAQRVTEDPFGKVKQLIQDLINRLVEEAAEDQTHHGWCTTELEKNEQSRTRESKDLESLETQIDLLQASITQLDQEVKDLTVAAADDEARMAEQTKLRNAEKATNEETIADAADAEAAVAEAITVLKNFYDQAEEATALVQGRRRLNVAQEPEIFDSPYTGMQDGKHGVIAILEVIQADFVQLQSDTRSEEATAEDAYKLIVQAYEVDKAQRSTSMGHKQDEQRDKEQDLQSKQTDLSDTQSRLDAAMAYHEKLKPSCVNTGATFEERTIRRQQEIESLQEALRILNGEDLATNV